MQLCVEMYHTLDVVMNDFMFMVSYDLETRCTIADARVESGKYSILVERVKDIGQSSFYQ